VNQVFSCLQYLHDQKNYSLLLKLIVFAPIPCLVILVFSTSCAHKALALIFPLSFLLSVYVCIIWTFNLFSVKELDIVVQSLGLEEQEEENKFEVWIL